MVANSPYSLDRALPPAGLRVYGARSEHIRPVPDISKDVNLLHRSDDFAFQAPNNGHKVCVTAYEAA